MMRQILIGLLLTCSAWAGELYVFAPSFAKSNLIEKEVGPRVRAVQTQAFGRFSDFKAMVSSQKPSAILAPMETIRSLGFSGQVQLYGVIHGKTSEPMVLVSLDKPLPLNGLDSQTIGLISILDRPNLKQFLERQIHSKPKANPATKLEDLLPMLTFQSATGILISASQAKQLKDRSEANLVVQPIPDAYQESLVLVILADEAKTVVNDIEKLPKTVLELLDVEGWKR